jgi:hypothetical protein
MTGSHALSLSIVLAVVMPSLAIRPAAPQDIGLAPIENTELARGYRASTLRARSVVNEKGERIGRIDDFIFGRDEHIFIVLTVGGFGFDGHLVAVPFRKFKFDDSNGNIVLAGANRAALEKLPVFLYDR